LSFSGLVVMPSGWESEGRGSNPGTSKQHFTLGYLKKATNIPILSVPVMV